MSIRHEDGAVHEERWAAGIPDAGITRAVPWRIHTLVRAAGASAAAVARRLGTTTDAVQVLLLDHPAPADPAGGARRRRARYDISREQLRDLHRGRGLSFTEIGQRTGYSRTAINDLARTYGMPMDTGHGLLNSGKET